MATAQRRALDHLRRGRMLKRKHAMINRDMEEEQQAMPDLDSALDDNIGDELLRLIFTACHPLLSRDNLRNLGIDTIDVVNLRAMFDAHHPADGSLEAPLAVLADLQRQGLVRHIGLSHVTPSQIAEAQRICKIVCVQNHYNLAHRDDDALIDDLCRDSIAYVPYFPLGGFTPLQSSTLSEVGVDLGTTPMQVALAWLLRRAPNILLIPGTSSVGHLRENLSAAKLTLSDEVLARLDTIGKVDTR